MEVMEVCIKANLWEAYSVLHKTIKVTAAFIRTSCAEPSICTTPSAFRRRAGAEFPSHDGFDGLASRPWLPGCAYQQCHQKAAWPLWHVVTKTLMCKDKGAFSECFGGFRASVKLPMSLISEPAILSNLGRHWKRDGMFPSGNASAQVLLGWVFQNYEDVVVWERSSYDIETWCLENQPWSLQTMNLLTNIYPIPMKCCSLEGLKKHKVPTFHELEIWLEKKKKDYAMINYTVHGTWPVNQQIWILPLRQPLTRATTFNLVMV